MSHVIGVIQDCQDCDWNEQSHLKEHRRKGYYHAKQTRHKVIAEVTVAYFYDGKGVE